MKKKSLIIEFDFDELMNQLIIQNINFKVREKFKKINKVKSNLKNNDKKLIFNNNSTSSHF